MKCGRCPNIESSYLFDKTALNNPSPKKINRKEFSLEVFGTKYSRKTKQTTKENTIEEVEEKFLLQIPEILIIKSKIIIKISGICN